MKKTLKVSGYVLSPLKVYRNSGIEPVDIHAQRWAEDKDFPPKNDTQSETIGCVFAKSCDLADGVIDHKKPAGFFLVFAGGIVAIVVRVQTAVNQRGGLRLDN